MENYKILTINPGSTSTKIGIFENENLLLEQTLRHSTEELEIFENIYSQLQFREQLIENFLKNENIDLSEFSAIVGRGGLVKPMISGTYEINEELIQDLKNAIGGSHASNLGGILAKEIAKKHNLKSFIVDPVVVDEMDEVARITGIKNVFRKSKFHALNQKAVAKRFAKEINRNYEELNLIVVHLGGGISVGAHRKGRVIDVTNAIGGEGPFTPERCGQIPADEIIEMCYSGNYQKSDMKKLISGTGGITSLLGTNDVREILKNLENPETKLIYDAFIYQIAKEIGAMATTLNGDIDQIILTGGIAYSEVVTGDIIEKIKFISEITIYPGEDELLALCQGALRILNNYEKVKIYD